MAEAMEALQSMPTVRSETDKDERRQSARNNWAPLRRSFMGVGNLAHGLNQKKEEEESDDEEMEEPKTVLRARGLAISAEAYGPHNNRVAAFVATTHEKSDEH